MPKKHTPVVSRLPITQARINLGQLAKRAHVDNEYFILEKDGIPVIGIMNADELEDYLKLQDPDVRQQIQQSHAEYLAGKSRPADQFLAERAARKRRTKPPRA